MKNRKAYILTTICLLSALVLGFLLYIYLSKGNIYYDNQRIANSEDQYSAKDFVVDTNENGRWDFSIGYLSGAKTLTSFSVDKSGQISLDASCHVSNGTFKIVLVDIDNKEVLATLCDNSDSDTLNNFEICQGQYALKAVGKNATSTGYFSVTISK